MNPYETLCLLIGLHFLCDYTLQTDPQARGKSAFAEPLFGVPWYYWNASHAATHGLAIGLALGSFWFGLVEFAIHFLIDAGKSKKVYGLHIDQSLHIACKVAYVLILTATGVPQ